MVRIYKQNEYISGQYSISILNMSQERMTRFNELLTYAKTLQKLCEEGEEIFSGFTNLVGDIWAAFYTANIQLPKQKECNLHVKIIEKLITNQEYNNWKNLTELDELLSIITTEFLVQRILTYFHSVLPPHNQLNPKMKNEKANQLLARDITILLNVSKGEVLSLKKDLYEVSAMYGKQFHQLSIKEQLQLAKELQSNPSLKQIADLTGKLKPFVTKKQQREEKDFTIHNIHVGQEISKLIPMELAKFKYPLTRLDFLRRFSEYETFQYDATPPPKGIGPIVFCIDESSSMYSIKNECKAFSLALLMIAKKQKRDMVIIPFSDSLGEVQYFYKGHSSIEQLMDFCNSFLSGGTNFELPLLKSLEIINDSPFKKADILFLTDGSSFLATSFIERFNQAKKQKSCECVSIILTNYFNAVDLTLVERFSDKVIEVNDLFEATEAFSIGNSFL
ncbi:VWA domain-containing protein [Lysinibacillus endophyticus]|uniref:vWA domain-containing protein n=1 Tax=Ureibacillus endophyticus TaxID=1978490 RepID=UPI00313544EC